MEGIQEILMPGVLSILGTIITVAFSIVSYKITKWGKEYINNQNTKFTTEQKRAVVNSTVAYVEQVFKDLDGAQKLQEARNAILISLEKQGIDIDEDEMQILIEAAVLGLKQGQNKAETEMAEVEETN